MNPLHDPAKRSSSGILAFFTGGGFACAFAEAPTTTDASETFSGDSGEIVASPAAATAAAGIPPDGSQSGTALS